MRKLHNRTSSRYIIISSIIFAITLMLVFLPALQVPIQRVGNIFSPVARLLYRTKVASANFWLYLSQDIESTNTNLRNDNEKLQANLAEMGLVAKENETLRSQLNIQKKTERNLALAHVIGERPGSFSRFLVLDIGLDNNLRPGLPVIINNALVGRIEKVYQNSAEMSLLTDPNSSYYSYLATTKTKGLIKGTIGLGILHLTQIPKNTVITPGENIFTTGQELENFNNILIGTVTESISNDQDTYLTLLVKPTVETQNLDTVFVVIH